MPDKPELKFFKPELKCPDPDDKSRVGQMTMTIATLDVVDRHWDVIRPGALGGKQVVHLSPFQHALWDGGHVPIGAAVMYESGDKLMADAEFNMELAQARETWSAISFALKSAPDLLECSFGFRVDKCSYGEWKGEYVRFLEAYTAKEVCPVLFGAGIDTGIAELKSESPYKARVTKAAQSPRLLLAIDDLRRMSAQR